jgi:hypothetical protein
VHFYAVLVSYHIVCLLRLHHATSDLIFDLGATRRRGVEFSFRIAPTFAAALSLLELFDKSIYTLDSVLFSHKVV